MRSDASARAGWRQWAGLAVLALPAMLVMIDMSVLHLAVPRLSADLDPSASQLLWITDIAEAGCGRTPGVGAVD